MSFGVGRYQCVLISVSPMTSCDQLVTSSCPTLDRDAVYMLTSADIESGQYSLRDVVLPTVGTATILPGNRTADK